MATTKRVTKPVFRFHNHDSGGRCDAPSLVNDATALDNPVDRNMPRFVER